MAITAAMYNTIKCVNKWDKDDIDLIVHQGDQNHFRFRNKYLYSNDIDGRVALDDIPKTFTVNINEQKAIGMQIDEWAGPVSYANKKLDKSCRDSCPSLIDVLTKNMKANRPIIATIDEFTVLFMKVGSDIWLFDSHDRDKWGNFALGNGKAFAAPFSTVRQLERYLLAVYGRRSIFFAASLKIWIPDEHVTVHQKVVRKVERRLLAIAAQRKEYLELQKRKEKERKASESKGDLGQRCNKG